MVSKFNNYDRIVVMMLLLFMAVLYIITMPIHFDISEGASEFSEIGKGHIRARHLLTTPLYQLIQSLNSYFNLFANSFVLAELFNILLSMVSASILYMTLVRAGISKKIAAYLLLLFLISHAVWLHSITTDKGIQQLFFINVSLFFLVNFFTSDDLKTSYVLYSFSCICLSTLFSLNNILFIPGLLIGAFLKLNAHPNSKIILMKLSLELLLIFLILIIVPFYWAVSQLELQSWMDLVRWLTYHPDAKALSHIHLFNVELILRPISGLISLLIDPGQSTNIVKAHIQHIRVYESIYFALPLLFFELSLLVIYGYLVGLGFFRLSNFALKTYLLITLCFFLLFNIYWLGSDPRFWLPVEPLFIFLIGFGIESFDAKRLTNKYFMATCLAVLCALIYFNLPKEIPSLLYPKGGKELQEAYAFDSSVKDAVVFTPGNSWCDFLPFISNKIKVMSLIYDDFGIGVGIDYLANLDKQIDSALLKSKAVYFDALFLPLHAKQIGFWELFQSKHEVSREELLTFLQEKYNISINSFGLTKISISQ